MFYIVKFLQNGASIGGRMSQLLQEGRPSAITSPLGKDVLALARFDATEGVSELFEFRIEALSASNHIDFDQALGHNCCVTFSSPDGPDRHFNGVMVEAEAVGAYHELFLYRIVLRPWLWLLSRTSDCRIWHDKTVIQIIDEVFRDRGFSDFKAVTTKPYCKIEYCVQYRETDLNFVCRLMESFGIYYFFEHSAGTHMLKLADSKSSHEAVPGHATISYFDDLQERHDVEYFRSWSSERQFRSGKYKLNDYDFKQPTKKLQTEKESASKYSKGHMEIYDYPGLYTEMKDGEESAKVRLDADQAQDKRRYARGNAISLFPGGFTTLDRHPLTAEKIEYLILSAKHSFVAQSYRSGGSGEADYSGNYELHDASIPYRPPLLTPKALIHGPQTARVVGEEGQEIDVDKYGRVLLLFHWDRKEMKSCRVRVAQVWAGKQWGGQFIPRIGMEAVVEFLEGDPDRPLVVGAVFNGDNEFPYALPKQKTQSGIKSDSTLGHGGYNELMFDDAKDSELIRMHAQKDHQVTVLNTETNEIGEKFQGGIGASRTTTLDKGSDHLTIQAGDQIIKISGNQAVTADQSIKLTCGASVIEITPTEIKVTSGHIAFSAPKIDWN
jgi:type VI secretion system secreted protein VgrG